MPKQKSAQMQQDKGEKVSNFLGLPQNIKVQNKPSLRKTVMVRH